MAKFLKDWKLLILVDQIIRFKFYFQTDSEK